MFSETGFSSISICHCFKLLRQIVKFSQELNAENSSGFHPRATLSNFPKNSTLETQADLSGNRVNLVTTYLRTDTCFRRARHYSRNLQSVNVKLHFLNGTFNPELGTIRAFLSKIRTLFDLKKKGNGGLPPSPSLARVGVAEDASISLNVFENA